VTAKELSETDIDMLAKALEYSEREEQCLFTDDFGCAEHRNPSRNKGHSCRAEKDQDVLIWEKQVHRVQEAVPEGDECPVCGSQMKRGERQLQKTDYITICLYT